MMKARPFFHIERLSARLLNLGDLDDIQTLMKACDDFAILVTGKPSNQAQPVIYWWIARQELI